MPLYIHDIAPDTMILGAHTTPDLARLKSLFLVLFNLIFIASKAQVARSNRAGQTKNFN